MNDKLIFFVDDDKMMLNLMEYTFKCRDGFEVKSYFSGEECLKNLALKPDLIVLDYYLGDADSKLLSGLETLKIINSSNIETSVMVLSREKNPDLINEFYRNGAKEYVIKDDFFIDTLIETIEEHFSSVERK